MPDLDQTTYEATIDYGLNQEKFEKATATCGDCGWKGCLSDLTSVVEATLTPGDPSPAGRCPECDSLAYVDQPFEDVEVQEREHDTDRARFLDQTPWLAVQADGTILEFETEEFACAYQRAWRRAGGADPITGERNA